MMAVFAALLPILAVLLGSAGASTEQLQQRQVATLDSGARQIALRLSRGLAEQWRELNAMLGFGAQDIESGLLRLRLDTAKALNDRLAWMGVARPDGRVLAATGGVLAGQDVSARPWFVAGLHGPFAGDVHDAVLLSRVLPRPEGAEPLRLIDFSAPLRRSDGSVVGVIGSHVDWGWVRDLVRSAPLAPDTDALLLARDGTVLVGPPSLQGTRLALRVALAGTQGVTATTEEEWPDGQRYLAHTFPAGAPDPAVPSFGWSVVVRQPAATAAALERGLIRRVTLPVVVASLMTLTIGLILARLLGRRFAALASAATGIAEGELRNPVPESRLTREDALLSAALARIDGATAVMAVDQAVRGDLAPTLLAERA